MNSPDAISKGNLLIVDDTPDNLRLLSSTLSDRGYKVRSVINGAMALMGAQAAPPDLIMLDIKMPDMDGYEVCQRLKANEQTREIPVIFISALDEVVDKVKAFTSGGVDYIQKPFQVEEVLARIENQLTIRRLQVQLQTQQVELKQALAQERALKQQIEELAAIEERNRIAREIHDSLGHSLTALNVQLQAAASLLLSDPIQAQSFLSQAQRLGTTAMQEVRQSVRTLRSDEKVEQSLEEAIAALAEEFRQVTGITPALHLSLTKPIPSAMGKTLYRIVQEALTNISKYAKADQVQIELATPENQVNLSLQDNGEGFSCEQATSGFGLQGMQERVAALNGKFCLNSKLGAGCQIKVELPIPEVQHDSPVAS